METPQAARHHYQSLILLSTSTINLNQAYESHELLEYNRRRMKYGEEWANSNSRRWRSDISNYFSINSHILPAKARIMNCAELDRKSLSIECTEIENRFNWFQWSDYRHPMHTYDEFSTKRIANVQCFSFTISNWKQFNASFIIENTLKGDCQCQLISALTEFLAFCNIQHDYGAAYRFAVRGTSKGKKLRPQYWMQ